jgi:hypothetical protein
MRLNDEKFECDDVERFARSHTAGSFFVGFLPGLLAIFLHRALRSLCV